MDQVKLSICVPTYNRLEHIKRILCFLKKEYDSLNESRNVEIIISDNNSNDGTEKFVKDFLHDNELRGWIYNKNPENLGLLGNLLKCEDLAQGKYIWWLGDDDYYKEGIVNAVIKHTQQNPDYIFLNYSYSKDLPWDGKIMKSVIDLTGMDKVRVADILKLHPGYLMFISASVYKKELIKELRQIRYRQTMALPLLYSLKCASKNNYIIDPKIWIDDNIKEISWKKESQRIFMYDVPYYVSLMPELGYSKSESKNIYKLLYQGIRKKRIKERIKSIIKRVLLLKFINNMKRQLFEK